MRILIVGPFEEWVAAGADQAEVRRAANGDEALELVATWSPDLIIVDPALVGADREPLVTAAESLGSRIIAMPKTGIRIPGSTIQDLERYAILETLKAVGGSTSRAAKMLGMSVRKIQYRLRGWREETKKPAERYGLSS